MDAASTRFHACERFRRCDYVAVDDEPADSDIPVRSRAGKRVVYINPVTMAAEGWKFYQEDTRQCLRTGEGINSLVISAHLTTDSEDPTIFLTEASPSSST